MKKLVIASTNKNAGKTTIAAGIAKTSDKSIGYIKPFGDRLIYHKKRLWDHDVLLMSDILGLGKKPDYASIGFAHAKLRYMYDEETTKKKILEMVANIGENKELMLIEGGYDLSYGASVHLDPISITDYVKGRLLLVVDGEDYNIMDNLMFIKKYIDVENVNLAGIIINKVKDVEDFKETYLNDITCSGIELLGILPYNKELTYMPVSYLAEHIFAKVIAGEEGIDKIIKHIFVADMSATAALQNPGFKQENKLVITGGDRSDTILAAIEHDTSCIILTNNIMPSPNIISKAADAQIPLLLIPCDSYHATMQIERIEPLLSKDDTKKINLIADMIKKHVEKHVEIGW